MNDESQRQEQNPPAYFPDASEKSPALLLLEEYLKQAEKALGQIQESTEKLQSALIQRQKELIVVSGQKELLLSLQKRLVPTETVNQESK